MEAKLFSDESYKEPVLIRQGYAGGYRFETFLKPNGQKMLRQYETSGRLYSELHLDGNGYYARKGTRFNLDELGNPF